MSGESGYCSEYGYYPDDVDIPEEVKPKIMRKDVQSASDRNTVGKDGEIMETQSKCEIDSAKKGERKVIPPGKCSTRVVLLNISGQPWYHGKMERKQAEQILSGKPPLTFLIRHSYKHPVPDNDGYLRNRQVFNNRCMRKALPVKNNQPSQSASALVVSIICK